MPTPTTTAGEFLTAFAQMANYTFITYPGDDADSDTIPQELLDLGDRCHHARQRRDQLTSRYVQEVLGPLRRNQRVPVGRELWLMWNLRALDEDIERTEHVVNHITEYWSPLGSDIPDFDALMQPELSYGGRGDDGGDGNGDVEYAYFVNTVTGWASEWFSVREVECWIRVRRRLEERRRVAEILRRNALRRELEEQQEEEEESEEDGDDDDDDDDEDEEFDDEDFYDTLEW